MRIHICTLMYTLYTDVCQTHKRKETLFHLQSSLKMYKLLLSIHIYSNICMINVQPQYNIFFIIYNIRRIKHEFPKRIFNFLLNQIKQLNNHKSFKRFSRIFPSCFPFFLGIII